MQQKNTKASVESKRKKLRAEVFVLRQNHPLERDSCLLAPKEVKKDKNIGDKIYSSETIYLLKKSRAT